jgi:hypothetical protein
MTTPLNNEFDDKRTVNAFGQQDLLPDFSLAPRRPAPFTHH